MFDAELVAPEYLPPSHHNCFSGLEIDEPAESRIIRAYHERGKRQIMVKAFYSRDEGTKLTLIGGIIGFPGAAFPTASMNQSLLSILHLTERPGHRRFTPVRCQYERTRFHNIIIRRGPYERAFECGL